jgi:tRNA A-37 threonylcarbamoyl transferase component Bud32
MSYAGHQMVKELITKYFGKPISIFDISKSTYCVVYKDKRIKLQIIGYKEQFSLPFHEKALDSEFALPKILKIEKINDNKLYKFTEWIDGRTINNEMNENPNLSGIICEDLGRYIVELFKIDRISILDPHFNNFVWNNNKVICIDTKSLFSISEEEHTKLMVDLCLQCCDEDRKKVLSFLKGYAKYKNVEPVLKEFDRVGWRRISGGLDKYNRGFFYISPIELKEL